MLRLLSYLISLSLTILIAPTSFGRQGAPPTQPSTTASSTADDPSLRSLRSANGLLQREQYELAIAEYRRFIDLSPNHPRANEARYGLASCLVQLNRLEDAAKVLAAIPLDDEFEFRHEAQLLLARCYLSMDQPADAVKSLNGLTALLSPAHELADDAQALFVEAAHRAQDHRRCIAACNAFRKQHITSELANRVATFAALSMMALEQHQQALDALNSIARSSAADPLAARASLARGECLERLGDHDRAIGQYRSLADQNDHPYRDVAAVSCARVLASINRHEESAKAVRSLLERNPAVHLASQANWMLAYSLLALEEHADAREALIRARELGWDAAETTYWIARCDLLSRNFDRAASIYRQLLDQHPDSPRAAEAGYDLAIAWVQNDRPEEASEILDQFRTHYPEHDLLPDVLHLQASVLFQKQAYDEAADICAAFVQRFPTHEHVASIRSIQAESLRLAGRTAEAIEALQAFIENYPDDPRTPLARLQRGSMLYAEKQFNEAEAALLALEKSAGTQSNLAVSLLILAEIAFAKSDWPLAESRYVEYLKTRSEHARDDAHFKLALAQIEQSNHPAAAATLSDFLTHHPASLHRTAAHFQMGLCRLAMNQADEAAAAFQSVVDRAAASHSDPLTHAALLHLGSIAEQRRNLIAAAGFYRAAADAATSKESAAAALLHHAQLQLAAGNTEQARDAFATFVERFPDAPALTTAQLHYALSLARLDQFEAAATAFSTIPPAAMAACDPSLLALAQYEYTWCLRKLDRAADAVASYRTLLNRDQIFADSLTFRAALELADFLSNTDQHDQAAQVLLAARNSAAWAAIDADLRAATLFRLGSVHIQLQRDDAAASFFAAFIESFPAHELLDHARSSAAEASLRLGRFEQAIGYLQPITDTDAAPELRANALLRLGESHAALQQWPKSIAAYQRHRAEFPDSPHWFLAQLGVGLAHEAMDEFDKALAAYALILDRHQGPTAARAQFQRGECFFALNRLNDAISEFLKVDILYSEPQWSAAALFEAGRCFQALARNDEARRQFQLVVDRFPDTEWAAPAAEKLRLLTNAAVSDKPPLAPPSPAN